MAVARLEREVGGERARTLAALRAPFLALGSCALVAGLAVANGGFFPTAWGWTALPSLAVAAAGLAAIRVARPGRLELVFLGALAGLVAWTWLSVLWTSSVTQTAYEGERALVLLGAVAAALALARAGATRPLLAGVAAAICGACAYGLATRLFPKELGTFDPLAAYRLAEPIGYWNGVGVFASTGLALCLAFALRGETPAGRALGAAALPLLATTLYFTYSRGSIVAFGIGVAVALAVDPRRLQLAAGLLTLAPATAAALVLASHSRALTHRRASLARAAHEGHRLAVLLVLLAVLSAAFALAFALLEQRLAVARPVRLAFAAALALALAAVLAGTFVRYGSPPTLVRKAYDGFRAAPPKRGNDLNERLLAISSSRRYRLWTVAWHEATAHPVLGGGAGSYGLVWLEHRDTPLDVQDAHSLYLETLAELGPLGLLLLLALLAAPVVAAVRARGDPVVPLALAAFVVFVVHAALDWDWELPAITLAALLCGLACLLAGRRAEAPTLPPRVRFGAAAAALALAAGAAVVLLGNAAVGASEADAAAGRYAQAKREAHTAIRWTPWLSAGWQQLGESELGLGELRAARRSLRAAIARDPRNWVLWLDLASVEQGWGRQHALRVATKLNPLGPEIWRFVAGP